jgi:hypothetical protein
MQASLCSVRNSERKEIEKEKLCDKERINERLCDKERINERKERKNTKKGKMKGNQTERKI